jgi:hypothetical protein
VEKLYAKYYSIKKAVLEGVPELVEGRGFRPNSSVKAMLFLVSVDAIAFSSK